MQDFTQNFIIEDLNIKGTFLDLNLSIQTALKHQKHNKDTKFALSVLTSISILIANQIKFQGTITFQIRNKNNKSFLIAECSSEGKIRATANKCDNKLDSSQDHLAMIIDNKKERYTSLIHLESNDLVKDINNYFHISEQLKSKFYFFQEKNKDLSFKCLLLQQIPVNSVYNQEHFNYATIIADTLQDAEIFNKKNEEILNLLYSENIVRIFEKRSVEFQCNCSKEKFLNILRNFEKERVEEENIEINCHFCGKKYYLSNKEI